MNRVDEADESSFQELSVRSEGSMVLIVQKMFNTIGYDLVEDGQFDADMQSVVVDFQTKSKSLKVNGVVDSKTMVELDYAIELQREAS
jgi:N-acetyl-anhydromuramyl-L-alanine amidase AmpD